MSALRLSTNVGEATINGAVPLPTSDSNCSAVILWLPASQSLVNSLDPSASK